MASCREQGRSASEALRHYIEGHLEGARPARPTARRSRRLIARRPGGRRPGRGSPCPPWRGPSLQTEFERLDLNGDRSISLAEFARLDTDHDGKVSFAGIPRPPGRAGAVGFSCGSWTNPS